jgi:hypothetical protein
MVNLLRASATVRVLRAVFLRAVFLRAGFLRAVFLSSPGAVRAARAK